MGGTKKNIVGLLTFCPMWRVFFATFRNFTHTKRKINWKEKKRWCGFSRSIQIGTNHLMRPTMTSIFLWELGGKFQDFCVFRPFLAFLKLFQKKWISSNATSCLIFVLLAGPRLIGKQLFEISSKTSKSTKKGGRLGSDHFGWFWPFFNFCGQLWYTDGFSKNIFVLRIG